MCHCCLWTRLFTNYKSRLLIDILLAQFICCELCAHTECLRPQKNFQGKKCSLGAGSFCAPIWLLSSSEDTLIAHIAAFRQMN